MISYSRPSRRQLLAMAAGLPVAAVLGGCLAPNAPKEEQDSAPSAGARRPAQIWTGWTETAAERIEAVIKRYNDAQDAVRARHVVVPGDGSAMSQKLLAAINAGNPPESAVVFGADVAYQLAARDALLSFEEVGTAEELNALKTWMTPAMWDLGQYEGKTYFLPMWSQCWGIFVNVDMAEKRGVDPDRPPESLDELDEVWERLTSFNANGGIDVLGGDIDDLILPLARHLGQLVSDDGRTITTNHPNNLAAARWIDNRWKRVGRRKLQAFYSALQGRTERSGGQDPFLAGLTATMTTGPWGFGNIVNYAPKGFTYTVWPLPRPAGVAKTGTYTYGDGYILPKKSASPRAGWEIARWLSGATGDEELYTGLFSTWLCVNGPTSEEVVAWPSFQKDVMAKCPGYEDVFLEDFFGSDYYLFPPKIPTSLSYTSLLSAEWEKVRLGTQPLEATFDKVTKQAQATLDQWHAEND